MSRARDPLSDDERQRYSQMLGERAQMWTRLRGLPDPNAIPTGGLRGMIANLFIRQVLGKTPGGGALGKNKLGLSTPPQMTLGGGS